MSLFQCDHCGCIENTALTNGCWGAPLVKDVPKALASYREVLGLQGDEEFGRYCSACTPIWFNEEGNYGIGPRPADYVCRDKDSGKWHGRFERRFLPKGEYETAANGNLRHKVTKQSPQLD